MSDTAPAPVVPNGFGLYDVPGAPRPLVLTPEHAEEVGGKLHVGPPHAASGNTVTRAQLQEQAKDLGLSTRGTKAELEARIAEHVAPDEDE